jgi:hypothetical protein
MATKYSLKAWRVILISLVLVGCGCAEKPSTVTIKNAAVTRIEKVSIDFQGGSVTVGPLSAGQVASARFCPKSDGGFDIQVFYADGTSASWKNFGYYTTPCIYSYSLTLAGREIEPDIDMVR